MQAGFQFTPLSTSWCMVLQMKPRASHCTISAPKPEPLGRCFLLRKERHKGQQTRAKLLNCHKHYMYLLTKPGTLDVLLQLLSKFVFKMCISVCLRVECMCAWNGISPIIWVLGTKGLFESSKCCQLLSHLSCLHFVVVAVVVLF